MVVGYSQRQVRGLLMVMVVARLTLADVAEGDWEIAWELGSWCLGCWGWCSAVSAVSCSVFWFFGFFAGVTWDRSTCFLIFCEFSAAAFAALLVYCFFVLVALAVFVGCWGRST
jgi:hypothetical protein